MKKNKLKKLHKEEEKLHHRAEKTMKKDEKVHEKIEKIAKMKPATKKKKIIKKEMHKFKEGELHSGSKKGPLVINPKQAIAIALSEARASKKRK